ncbi:MAG TPA: ATP synthase F0 subunit B, partial [Polyangiaceae bacterium]
MSLFRLAEAADLHDALHGVLSQRGGGVSVDFDKTLFVQVGLFIVLWLALKPLLFDPMLKLFEEREKKIEGTIADARKIDLQSADAKATYDEALAKARAAGALERDRLRAEGIKKENELLTAARIASQKKLDEGRTQSLKEVDAARSDLSKERQILARDVAARV